jgi:hypothetical protein
MDSFPSFSFSKAWRNLRSNAGLDNEKAGFTGKSYRLRAFGIYKQQLTAVSRGGCGPTMAPDA